VIEQPMTTASRRGWRLLDLAIDAFALAATLILAALVVLVGVEVVMRYFFGQPTRWVNEFCEYALLWLAFLAGPWVLREEAHVKVEMLTDALSPEWRHRFHVATSVVGAAVCALFCWVSAAYVLEVFGTGEFLFKSVQLPKWAVMAVMPPGLLLLAIQFVRRALRPPPAPASVGL
jgi:TRAP-type C4-dicarboxylate transport system permease small subunit